jgi:putative nucleotidyltransferase with HDIG domain
MTKENCEAFFGPMTDFAIAVIGLRDEATAGHSHRVANLCVAIGQRMNLSDDELVTLRIGGLLHDIGKMGVPDDILLKPGPLNGIEWQVMRQHPSIGASLLKGFPCFDKVVPIIEMHHERLDGSGYPQNLAGDQVPLLARICAVVEAYDGLLSEQVYKPLWTTMDVLDAMELRAGKSFDSNVIAALRSIGSEI